MARFAALFKFDKASWAAERNAAKRIVVRTRFSLSLFLSLFLSSVGGPPLR
jgi:hypothetical protein